MVKRQGHGSRLPNGVQGLPVLRASRPVRVKRAVGADDDVFRRPVGGPAEEVISKP